MAKQRIVHGAVLDVPTTDEIIRLMPRPERVSRIREPAQVQLDGSGSGTCIVYKVPTGQQFAVRRVVLNLNLASGAAIDPSSGNVPLNAAGKYVAYQRSGQFIEFGQPSYGSSVQVPGSQTWGDQQGAYLENGETFEVRASGLTANAFLIVTVEGILTRPKPMEMTNAPG